MTEFEENNPEQLKLFRSKLVKLIDEFHPNIYLMDEIFNGIEMIMESIEKELNK